MSVMINKFVECMKPEDLFEICSGECVRYDNKHNFIKCKYLKIKKDYALFKM